MSKIIVISCESLGIDPLKSDLLEIGLIVEDIKNPKEFDDLPKKRIWVDKEYYKGTPQAITANCHILNKICDLREKNSIQLVKPDNVCDKILNFLKNEFASFGKFDKLIPVAGFNYASLCKPFLSRLKDFESLPLDARSIEVHNQFINWNDDNLDIIPNFSSVKEKAGLEKKVYHDTISCCWDVINILRRNYVKE